MDERKKTLEDKCKKCFERFSAFNLEGRTFPYSRCKRCDVGRLLHQTDDPKWVADCVKREV
ncbi:hypothetical protein [uncultured Clostridium sp.]|uniref:hypothetical protein n=1 Tax=uncultured Clostridium sp. TaxID=59620 RepID=UPI002605762C|nr:hypothetical protein [uncultured Clostridium sp.]